MDPGMTENEQSQQPTTTGPSPRQARARTRSVIQDDVPHEAVARRTPDRIARAAELARVCARIADDNRAKEIVLLDLRHATPIVDYFVIATAASRRQSHAIASEIDAEMKKRGEAKLGMEGSEEGRWTLIDYGDFVVHIFSPADRSYYALDEIWGDAPHIEWRDAAALAADPPALAPSAPSDSAPESSDDETDITT
jgi:ribosome-associated protein